MPSIQQIAEQSIAFVHRAGLKVQECRPGYARCLMPLQGNENHVGAMYAGAQFTLADITGGVLALASFDPQQYVPLLKSLNLDFVKPANTALTLEYQLSAEQVAELQQTARSVGKASFPLRGELRNEQGETVAVASGVFVVLARDHR